MLMQVIVLAAISGWAFDDFCGTPPRWPGPRPGPGPWWIRKILAVVGGAGAFIIFAGGVVSEQVDLVPAILLGGVGGVFLPSIASGLMGGATTNQ